MDSIPEFLQCNKKIRNLKINPVPRDTKFKIEVRKDPLKFNSEVSINQTSANHWVGHIKGKGYVPFQLVIPDFAFNPNEAYLFEVVQMNAKQSKPSGGFTLLVHG